MRCGAVQCGGNTAAVDLFVLKRFKVSWCVCSRTAVPVYYLLYREAKEMMSMSMSRPLPKGLSIRGSA